MRHKRNQKLQKGFTLVELLVVIAIVGLLSSIVITSLNIVRAKGRDSKRVQDLNTLARALEMYYLDNGNYPVPPDQYWSSANYLSGNATYGWQNLQVLLSPYITKLPVDPRNNDGVPWGGPTGFSYAYGWVSTNSSGRQVYSLIATLEDPRNPLRCETQANGYPWHWDGGINICNNGGPGGWHYNLMGYQASHSAPP